MIRNTVCDSCNFWPGLILQTGLKLIVYFFIAFKVEVVEFPCEKLQKIEVIKITHQKLGIWNLKLCSKYCLVWYGDFISKYKPSSVLKVVLVASLKPIRHSVIVENTRWLMKLFLPLLKFLRSHFYM